MLWNNVSSVNVSLQIARTSLAVFDTMGNGRDAEAIAWGQPGQEAESVTVTLQAERPVFLQADGSALHDALSTMQIAPVFPATVSVSKRPGGAVDVSVTGNSLTPVDGIVSWAKLPGASASAIAPAKGKQQHFHSLGYGETQILSLAPGSDGAEVLVEAGDRWTEAVRIPVG